MSSDGPTLSTGTNIYLNGTLSTAVSGWTPGWLDDTRLLVNHYRVSPRPGPDLFDGSVIVNAAGQTLATPALSEMNRFQSVNATSVYSPELNLIIDLATGNTLWSSASPARAEGAVAGNFVVFASGGTVRAESR